MAARIRSIGIVPAVIAMLCMAVDCMVDWPSSSAPEGDQLEGIRPRASLRAMRNGQVWLATGQQYCYSSPGWDFLSGYCARGEYDSILLVWLDSGTVASYPLEIEDAFPVETVGWGPFYTPDSAYFAVREWWEYPSESDSGADYLSIFVHVYTADSQLVFELDEWGGPQEYADSVFWRFF